ncbi:hypothetical protein L596_023940 [Steinernema carpocapsae]|uniref:Fatty-acid and retinol-binding protein 1 n=1 Tax=Steinernema carpocapsae TaxID=34508 RepID=A0A4U5MF67_STECR|nr:hypothetical protein L596_023940 [Steinernema carpocapsae]
MKLLSVLFLLTSAGIAVGKYGYECEPGTKPCFDSLLRQLRFFLSNVFRETLPKEMFSLATTIGERDYPGVAFFVNATEVLRSQDEFFPLHRVFPLLELRAPELFARVKNSFGQLMKRINGLSPRAKEVAIEGLDYFDRYHFLNDNREATEAAEARLGKAFDSLNATEKAEIEAIFPAAKDKYRGMIMKNYDKPPRLPKTN